MNSAAVFNKAYSVCRLSYSSINRKISTYEEGKTEGWKEYSFYGHYNEDRTANRTIRIEEKLHSKTNGGATEHHNQVGERREDLLG